MYLERFDVMTWDSDSEKPRHWDPIVDGKADDEYRIQLGVTMYFDDSKTDSQFEDYIAGLPDWMRKEVNVRVTRILNKTRLNG